MSPLPMILLLLAQAQAPAPLSGTAIDPQGPMIDAEIVLAQGQAPDGSVPILARATTDLEGRYAIVVPAFAWRPTQYTAPCLFSYRPGSGLIASVTTLSEGDSSAYRLVSNAAVRRTFTLRSGDGRPMAGVRLAPVSVRPVQPNYFAVMIPDALVDRMEATTGPDGRAVLDSLAPATELMALRATVPGRGTQTLALAERDIGAQAVTLDLKPAGGIGGRVVRPDGPPAAGAAVEVWSRAGRLAPVAPVRFDTGPIRTGDDGRFRSPPGLLAGVKYRALIRADGFKPLLTEWVTPPDRADGTVELADFALFPLRTLAGRVVDRQGRPVPGAQVIAGGEGIEAATDGGGTFRLDGLTATRSLLVVRREGLRIDGRVIGDRDREVEVVLARFDEPARRPMTTLPGPLPLDERRKLARRVLDPFLTRVLAKGEDSPKAWALRSLMVFDPQAALNALGRTTFQKTEYYQSFLKSEITRKLAQGDEAAAAAVAETIPEAYRRAQALVDICTHLPDDRRDRKRELTDRVLAAARAEPVAKLKVWQLGEAAELLLDLGETERAKVVFAEGLPIARKLGPDAEEFTGYFASRLGRVDLSAALELLGGADRARDHVVAIGNLAARIAASQPAEAERLAGKIRGLPRGAGSMLRTCQNIAAADLSRARRLATSLDEPGLRSAALVFAAYGLPPSERKGPRDLLFRQALRDVDQARKAPARGWSSTSALMPLVESIDPALVPEFFWRTVADLAVANDPRSEYGRDGVLREAMLLARYDREVAAVLLEPAAKASAAKGPDAGQMTPSELLLLAVIDPRRAVAVVEAMPEPPNLDTTGANWSRIILSEALGGDDASRWKRIWGTFSGLGGILGRRDVLF